MLVYSPILFGKYVANRACSVRLPLYDQVLAARYVAWYTAATATSPVRWRPGFGQGWRGHSIRATQYPVAAHMRR